MNYVSIMTCLLSDEAISIMSIRVMDKVNSPTRVARKMRFAMRKGATDYPWHRFLLTLEYNTNRFCRRALHLVMVALGVQYTVHIFQIWFQIFMNSSGRSKCPYILLNESTDTSNLAYFHAILRSIANGILTSNKP